MVHGYNTRGKRQEPAMNNHNQMKRMEGNQINSLKDEIINLKVIVIRNLQDKNEKLRGRCERLEKQCSKYESDRNVLALYGPWNNIVLS